MHCKIVRQGAFLGSPGVLHTACRDRGHSSLFFTNRVAKIRKCIRDTTDKLLTNLGTTEVTDKRRYIIFPGRAVVNTVSRCVAGASDGRFRPVGTGFNVVRPLNNGGVHSGRLGGRVVTSGTLTTLSRFIRAVWIHRLALGSLRRYSGFDRGVLRKFFYLVGGWSVISWGV